MTKSNQQYNIYNTDKKYIYITIQTLLRKKHDYILHYAILSLHIASKDQEINKYCSSNPCH